MVAAKKIPVEERPLRTVKPSIPSGRPARLAMAVALSLGLIAISYALFADRIPVHLFPIRSVSATKDPVQPDPTSKPAKPEIRLSREAIDLLLDSLDQAKRRKDADGILRHIAHDAIITIHMKQGSQQQMTTLTREEYRTTLNMGFAFPSANDYTRVSTNVTLAPDERSAKVSFKSTETLRQERRELKVEGEETLIFRIRDDKPMIISLEQVVPGDST